MLPSSDRPRNAVDRIRARPFYPGSRLIVGRVASVAIRLSRSLGGPKLNPSRFKLRRSTGDGRREPVRPAVRMTASASAEQPTRTSRRSEDRNMTSLLLTASSPARRAMPQAAAAVSRRSRASAEVMGRSRPAHLMTNPSTSAGSSAVNACTICASDPDAIGSLSCAASSFSSASRISLAGMFNMVFNTLLSPGPR
jgi:hypothetical protein